MRLFNIIKTSTSPLETLAMSHVYTIYDKYLYDLKKNCVEDETVLVRLSW